MSNVLGELLAKIQSGENINPDELAEVIKQHNAAKPPEPERYCWFCGNKDIALGQFNVGNVKAPGMEHIDFQRLTDLRAKLMDIKFCCEQCWSVKFQD